jgi:hypothetical protein
MKQFYFITVIINQLLQTVLAIKITGIADTHITKTQKPT